MEDDENTVVIETDNPLLLEPKSSLERFKEVAAKAMADSIDREIMAEVEPVDAETAKMIDEWIDQSSEQFWKNIRKIEKDLREQDADS